MDNFVQAPLFFTVEEQTALLHAAVFAKAAGYFLDEELDNATLKLKKYSNEEQEKMLEEHLVGLEVISQIGKLSVESVLKKLRDSIANELSVKIEYHTSGKEKSKIRTIDPYGIVYWNNRWYVIAFCHLRNEIRNFRVDRIISIMEIENTFNLPKEFSAGEFFMKGLLDQKEDNQKFIPLIIGGKIDALDGLCQHWFLGHYVKERTHDKITFLLEEEVIYKYVPNILLPYRKSIEVIEPLSLKQKIIESLFDLIEYYKV